jgi:DNA repair exonuclease SbcCD ATPase subunit
MRITSLTLEGFRAFGKQQTFKFPATPGVYMITGKNEVDTYLGANGVGKTSFAEGLCWTLYGKTSRGQKASAVGHWSGDYVTACALELDTPTGSHIIERRWNPNALTHRLADDDEVKRVTQPDIDDQAGMDYDTFLASVLFSQSEAHFMDLGATDQLAALCSALKLDQWQACAKRAHADAGALASQIWDNDAQLAATKVAIAETREQLKQFKQLNRQHRAQEDELRAKLENDLNEELEKESAIKADLKKATSDIEELEGYAAEKLERHSAAQAKELALEAAWIAATDAQVEASIAHDQVARQVKRAEVLAHHGKCAECEQTVPASHSKRRIDALKKQAKPLLKALRKLDKKVEKAERASKGLDGKEQAAQEQLRAADLDLQRRQGELRVLLTRLADKGEQLRKAKTLLKDHSQRDNLIPDQISQVSEKLVTLRSERKAYTVKAKDLERKQGMATYWAAAFMKLRLWLIERALKEFEANINNSLQALGLVGWVCLCSTEKELKSGDSKAALSVTVQTPEAPDVQVPWKSWSGGEAQRLRVAGAAAFSDLVCSRMGAAPFLEIWDEPTQHLSQVGCEDLMEFFEQRSRLLNKQLWIIDHRTTNSAGITATYRFRKTHQGTLFPKLPD